MITPPTPNAPPAVVLKANVAATGFWPATRSDGCNENKNCVGCPPITPDAMAADGVTSTLVRTVTSPPAVAAPMVKPESVMVTAVEAAIGPPATLTAVELAPDVAVSKLRPCDEAEIVLLAAKKPVG